MSYSSMFKLGDCVIIFNNKYDYEIYDDEISKGLILKDNGIDIEIIHQFNIGYEIRFVENNHIVKRFKLNEDSIGLLPPDIKIEKNK